MARPNDEPVPRPYGAGIYGESLYGRWARLWSDAEACAPVFTPIAPCAPSWAAQTPCKPTWGG